MAQPKVFEFAKEVGLETLTLMEKLREWDIPVKSHMATLDTDTIEAIRNRLKEEKGGKKAAAPVKKKVAKKKVATAASPAAAATDTAAGSKVIRRKAGSVPSVKIAEERARKEAEKVAKEAEIAEEAQLQAKAQAEAEEARAKNVETPSVEGAATGEVKAAAPVEVERKRMITGRSIVGKMDLTRATRPPQGGGYNRYNSGGASDRSRPQSGSGPNSGSGQANASGSRMLRPGFVKVDNAKMPLATNVPFEENSRFRKDDKKKRPLTAVKVAEGVAVPKDDEVPEFEAAEFRKREVVFQPKKKKIITNREMKKTTLTTMSAAKRVVKVEGRITVADFAKAMATKAGPVIATLVKNGVEATMNTEIDFETASLIAPEFGFEVLNVEKSIDELTAECAFGDLDAKPVPRSPIVTVMGHVDHGKTTLLDSIRKTNVVKGEAGGITQHIGAYSVTLGDGKKVTFIDTPGHAAFTAMRARGATVTDIAVIVVAVDDGLMPQTAEAINHAKAAGVPIVVAVNKMDKPGANPEKIKQQLTEFELVPEEWGGTTHYAPVSAIKGDGIEALLESLHLIAEIQELKANPKRSATGVVIEAEVKKGRGNVATLLVRDGSMEIGQYIVAGRATGRIRAMINDKGQNVKKAGPSDPVEVLGLEFTPQAGDRFDICKTEEIAKAIAKKRTDQDDKKIENPNSAMSMDLLFAKAKAGDVKELAIVIKTDVAGSGEAIRGMLDKASTDAVKLKIVHNAVGGINESDVLLAGTAGGMVVGFNVRPDAGAQRLAKQNGVEIKTYSIVYELLEDIEKAMLGMLDPEFKEEVLGMAEVRNVFGVPKQGVIAGCFITQGKVTRNAQVRLVREGRVIYTGKVASLKRFKDDAKEVATGFECGLAIENFNDIKVGDTIEAFEVKQVVRT